MTNLFCLSVARITNPRQRGREELTFMVDL
jgi:hypothetical protein